MLSPVLHPPTKHRQPASQLCTFPPCPRLLSTPVPRPPMPPPPCRSISAHHSLATRATALWTDASDKSYRRDCCAINLQALDKIVNLSSSSITVVYPISTPPRQTINLLAKPSWYSPICFQALATTTRALPVSAYPKPSCNQ